MAPSDSSRDWNLGCASWAVFSWLRRLSVVSSSWLLISSAARPSFGCHLVLARTAPLTNDLSQQINLCCLLRVGLSQPPILGLQSLYLLIVIVQRQVKGLCGQRDSPFGLRHHRFPDWPPNVTVRPLQTSYSVCFSHNFTKVTASTSLLTPKQEVQSIIYSSSRQYSKNNRTRHIIKVAAQSLTRNKLG